MLLKVNTSNTDHSGIHAIDASKACSINSVGLTALDIVFYGGYENQNSVFRFTINSNTANKVINCIGVYMDKHIKARSALCTLFDNYSNFSCCSDITGVTVKTRKV